MTRRVPLDRSCLNPRCGEGLPMYGLPAVSELSAHGTWGGFAMFVLMAIGRGLLELWRAW